MALTDENGGGIPATMLVSPTGYAGNNGGFGFGGDWAWILLLLLLGGNGWGFGGFGGGGMMWPMMMSGMGYGMDYLYPWLNNSQHISDGFRDQQLQGSINSLQNSVTSGFGDVQLGIAGINQNLCQTGNGIVNALNNGFSGAEIAANSRQIANMQQAFAAQTAAAQGFNAVQNQLAQCCCDNRAGLADLRYTVATEACADRAAVNDALRDVLAANTASTQRILDQLCQDKIDAKNDTINQLRQELLYARGQASQDVQTATLRAGQATTANQLIQELRSCPVPSMPVYGMTPIFSCNNNNGCGCNNGFAN